MSGNPTPPLKAYLDSEGIPTIGWGNTRYNDGKPVKLGDEITLPQAIEMLNFQLLNQFVPGLRKLKLWSGKKLSVRQMATLISFAWNVGEGFVGDDDGFFTINRALSSIETLPSVPKALELYTNKGVLGLRRRRRAEGYIWNGMSVADAANKAWSEIN